VNSEILYGCSSEAEVLVRALSDRPNSTAIQEGELKITYRELANQVSRYVQALAAMGLGRGDRVGLLSGNCVEVIYVNCALSILGCCLVPMHPKGSLRDHVYFVRDSGLQTLIFDSSHFAVRAGELSQSGVRRLIGIGPAPGAENLPERAGSFAPQPLQAPVVGPSEICRLSYSGGTTGEPKAIMGTYLSLLTKLTIQLIEWEWPAPIRQLICAPLSHAGGAMVLPTLVRGGSVVIMSGFQPLEVMRAVQKYRINCMLLVPTMIVALLDHPDLDRYDMSSLEVIYYGAAPISPARLREGIKRLGSVFFQFYGQTESPLTVSVMRRNEHDVNDPERLASCGRPVPWVRVALLDDAGQEVADGAPGEICVRGPLVMQGYWNKPEQTREALQGDWLHTGDMAVRNRDGFLRIVDRKKDMIISGGFNIFAREVEEAVCEHPSVAACAVFGTPDPHWGEAVVAAVVLRSGASATAEEIIALVRQIKGPVQAPKFVEFLRELPLTSLGKPDKKALRMARATNVSNGAIS
jgi:fatty-acyl-CoA synthase